METTMCFLYTVDLHMLLSTT